MILDNIELLKELTEGEVIKNIKEIGSTDLRPFSKLIFSTSKLPNIKNKSTGLSPRVIIKGDRAKEVIDEVIIKEDRAKEVIDEVIYNQKRNS